MYVYCFIYVCVGDLCTRVQVSTEAGEQQVLWAGQEWCVYPCAGVHRGRENTGPLSWSDRWSWAASEKCWKLNFCRNSMHFLFRKKSFFILENTCAHLHTQNHPTIPPWYPPPHTHTHDHLYSILTQLPRTSVPSCEHPASLQPQILDFISNDVMCSWGLWLTNRSIKLPSLHLFLSTHEPGHHVLLCMYLLTYHLNDNNVKPSLCALLRDCVYACIVGLTLQVTFSFVFLIPLTFGWHSILYKEKIAFILFNPHYNAWGTGLCSFLVIVHIGSPAAAPPTSFSWVCSTRTAAALFHPSSSFLHFQSF